MTVQQYAIRTLPVLEAAYWQGHLVDLQGFSMPLPDDMEVNDRGVLTFTNCDNETVRALPNESYVILGVTGHFFVMDKMRFDDTYDLVGEFA